MDLHGTGTGSYHSKENLQELRQWIVASSLEQSAGAPYDAFAADLDQINSIFATRNFDVVFKRLAALSWRFANASQTYSRQEWSTDLDFWQCADTVLWTGKLITLPHSSNNDRDERLRFLMDSRGKLRIGRGVVGVTVGSQ
ncbi:uncharacterized protein RCO7_11241 [Rhynchosporium graminicola]|uniref:Uncharacterized protein n=1 Tax=Rhynchosporium graminicola TaxID=2792576 RepID=A0A1E1LB81_9HELO|nr:uncharacterized protein RCO7_11241 [Rhynchosporium commune]